MQHPATPTKVSPGSKECGLLVHSPGANKDLNELQQMSPIEHVLVSWINYHLQSFDLKVHHLRTDLRDGQLLISLVSKLTNQLLQAPHTHSPLSLQDKIENVELAISVLKKDGLKIIHNDDAASKLVEGNWKFTIELCKTLVLHYHCTFSNASKSSCMSFQHKKRLLMWLSLVIPGFAATDLIPGDWIEGSLLSSLLQYCLSSDSSTADKSKVLTDIVQQASESLSIPPLLQMSDLHSTSGDAKFILMMYLYFFVKLGQVRLLQWVNERLDTPASDLQQDWADGRLVYHVVHSLIPHLPSHDDIASKDAVHMIELAINGASQNLSISSQFSASDISTPTIDPLPLVLFLTQLQMSCLPSSIFIRRDLSPLQCVGSRVSIEVDNLDSPDTTLQATLQDQEHDLQVMDSTKNLEKGFTTFFFTPEHVGHFTIKITCNGREIPENPINLDVYDPEKCEIISSLRDVYLLEQPIALDISTSKAGKGELAASLTAPTPSTLLPDADSALPNTSCVTVDKLGDQLYKVIFTPHEQGIYQLSLTFNGKKLPNPLKFDCRQINFKSTPTGNLFRLCAFNKDVTVSVTDPHGNDVEVQDRSSFYCYTPSKAGEHTISVSLNGHPMEGSPFTLLHPEIYVREHSEDPCVVNQPITVVLDASAGITDTQTVHVDGFNIAVSYEKQGEQGGSVPIKQKCITIKQIPEEKNVFTVQFTPEEVGTYSMSIAYNDEPLPHPDDNYLEFQVGKPKVCVRQSSQPPHMVNKPIVVILEAGVDQRDVEVLSQGELISTKVDSVAEEDGVLTVQFTPHKTGQYKMNFRGEAMDTLCFDVIKPVLLDPELSVQEFSHDNTNCLVKVDLCTQDGILEGFKKCANDRPQDLSRNGSYSVMAVGKQTSHVLYPSFSQVQEGKFSIGISTNRPDVYMLHIDYYGDLISCCPYPIDITSKVTTYDPVIPFEAGASNSIELVLDTCDAPKTSTEDFTVRVFSAADNSFVSATVEEESPDLFRVAFLPRGDDEFKIDISWFCLPICISPLTVPYKQQTCRSPVSINFQPNVGSRVSIAAKLLNAEHQNTDLHTEAVACLYDPENTSLADDHSAKESSGHYNVSLPRIAIQQYKRGYYEISFLDDQKGKYLLHVFCLGQEIRGSPFAVDTTHLPQQPPSVDGAHELTSETIDGYNVFSASVKVHDHKARSVSISLKATPELATVEFEGTKRSIYDLELYWNYVQFKGGPFLLTKHHDAAANS